MFEIERLSWYQIKAYGHGKFSMWKKDYPGILLLTKTSKYLFTTLMCQVENHFFWNAMAYTTELNLDKPLYHTPPPYQVSQDVFCQIWCLYGYVWPHSDTIFEFTSFQA